MANRQSEVFEAFRLIGVPEESAVKAAGALAKRDDDVTTIKADIQVIKTELQLVKWLMGIMLAFVISIALKLFVH